MTMLYPIPCYNEARCKGTVLYSSNLPQKMNYFSSRMAFMIELSCQIEYHMYVFVSVGLLNA